MSNPASAIANEFLKKPSALGKLTQMQLQKLAYITHGWTLAITGDPLVMEPVQAWDYGPVFPGLYDHTKLYGKAPIARLVAESDDSAPIFFSEALTPMAGHMLPSLDCTKQILSTEYGINTGI